MQRQFSPFKETGIKNECRLVIFDSINNSFIAKHVIEPMGSATIEISNEYDKYGLKYKYQVKSDNDKWLDLLGGYKYLVRKRQKNLMDNFLFTLKDIENISELKSFSENDLKYYFKHLLLNFYKVVLKVPTTIKVTQVRKYLGSLPNEMMFQYDFIAHCVTLITLLNDLVEAHLNSEDIEHDYGANIILLDNSYHYYGFDTIDKVGCKTGLLVAKGNVFSLFNRELAFASYQKALKLGNNYIGAFLTVDALSTYYPVIHQSNTTFDIIDNNSHKIVNESAVNVCFSADLSYFQMFAINWAQACFYFKDLIFNFGIVTNSEDEFSKCVESYNKIISGLLELLDSSQPFNYRFFWIKSSIINKTVYACARFYLAHHLLKNYYGNVFISDIDQLIIGDFQQYLKRVTCDDYSVYQPIMPNLYSLLPGRSHLAGNIYIANNSIGRRYCELLTDYSGMGLEEEFSWMLDQNATRYASEHIDVGNLDIYGKRVLKQYPDLKRTLRD